METLDFKDKDIEPRVCGNCINFETVPINDDSSEHVLEKGFCRILKEIVNIETEACDDWEFRGNQIPDILKGPFCEAVVLDEIPNIDLVDFYERLIGRKEGRMKFYEIITSIIPLIVGQNIEDVLQIVQNEYLRKRVFGQG